MIDWNDLRYALAVAEAGTLRSAARRLGVDPSTVGRRLGALEAALGTTLYLKSARGYAPTAAGERLLRTLGELGRGLEALEREAAAPEGEPAGVVRAAVTEVTAQHLLESAVPALAARHPRLVLELVTGNAATDLARAEADVAVRFLKPAGVELVGRPLGKLWYGLYASPSYLASRRRPPSAAERLAGHDLLWPSRELRGGPEHAWLREHGAAGRAALLSNSLPAIAAAAAAGLGLAVLPAVVGEAHPGLERALYLASLAPRAVWLLYHRDARSVARVRATADAIADDVRARVARYAPPAGGPKG
jgi:DNA-binding transcriptional LysR family regulator